MINLQFLPGPERNGHFVSEKARFKVMRSNHDKKTCEITIYSTFSTRIISLNM